MAVGLAACRPGAAHPPRPLEGIREEAQGLASPESFMLSHMPWSVTSLGQ